MMATALRGEIKHLRLEESRRKRVFHESALFSTCPELSVFYEDMLVKGSWKVDTDTFQARLENNLQPAVIRRMCAMWPTLRYSKLWSNSLRAAARAGSACWGPQTIRLQRARL